MNAPVNDERAIFLALVERAKAGCANARRELYETYGAAILRVVRHRLHSRMRTVFDSRDFTQDVWASFFALSPSDFAFTGPDHLAEFLQSVAENKVTEVFRQKMLGVRENLNREQNLADIPPPLSDGATPSQHAIADEGWQQLLAGQPPMMRNVLVLLREGYTYEEVGCRTGLHPKAIQRRVQRLTKRIMP
jgi:RNA polymerase sigma factor (sigma-70 family)